MPAVPCPNLAVFNTLKQGRASFTRRRIAMDSDWDIPAPILVNLWKHHAGFLQHRIAEALQAGPEALRALSRSLVVVGTDLMDLYHGPLTPAQIAGHVRDRLQDGDRLAPERFHAWIAEAGGYRVLSLADQSRWVLRAGDSDDRYVHLHPARRGSHTIRVRAHTLKTAVLAIVFSGLHHANVLDDALVNRVRREFLGLPPMKVASTESEGLRRVLALLRDNRRGA